MRKTHENKKCHCEEGKAWRGNSPGCRGSLPIPAQKIEGIATLVCALARNDIYSFDTLNLPEY